MFIAIVLAAGLSTRFPGNKLLYKWWGKPVIKHTVENILNSIVDRVVVVTGYMVDEIEKVLKDVDDRVELVYNPNYVEGMSSSVKTGVKHVVKKYDDVEALVFTPGDCAWIPSIVYDLMITKFREDKPLILVASYQGVKGHPIMFNSELIPDLVNVSEETRGLKHVVKKYYWGLRIYETNQPGVLLDLDTYNDLNRVKYMVKK